MSKKRKRTTNSDDIKTSKKPKREKKEEIIVPDPGPELMIRQSKELIAPWCRPHSKCMYLVSQGYQAPDHHQKPTHRLGCCSFIPNYDRNIKNCTIGDCEHKKRNCPMIVLGCLMQVAQHFSDPQRKSNKYGIFEGTPAEMRELYIPFDAILELVDIAVKSGHSMDQPFESVYQRSSYEEPMVTVQTCLASAVFLFDGNTYYGNGLDCAVALISKLLTAGANPNVPIVGHIIHPRSMTKSSFARNYDNCLHVLFDMVYSRFRRSTYTIGHVLDYVPDENEWKGVVVERKQDKYDTYPEDFKRNVEDVQHFKQALKLLVTHGANFNVWSAPKGQYYSNAWIQCMFVQRDYIRQDLRAWCIDDVLQFVNSCSESERVEAFSWSALIGDELMQKVCRVDFDFDAKSNSITKLMVLCLALNYLAPKYSTKYATTEKNTQVTAEQCLNRVKFLYTGAHFDSAGFDFAKYVNRFMNF
jgi:hypothetical protein